MNTDFFKVYGIKERNKLSLRSLIPYTLKKSVFIDVCFK